MLTDRFARSDDLRPKCTELDKYCGGTFKGIEKNLDYITGLGFDAIWISPIPENLPDSYHGYGFLNWYKVNEHFGTEDDLKSLVNKAHDKGVWVMLDVVANHVAQVDEDYSRIHPFNESSHYHNKCEIQNYSDPFDVEYCRIYNFPDLD